ncbi:MAG: carboxypeptidase-like regulatory domain-containing protein [Cryomorphaceae bacterium]|nr:carboxypeptidase-like regulatory domain-containing protein [Cryomorphaceae bacterium]
MLFKTLFTALLLTFSFSSFSQSVSIKGTVQDAKTLETIPGVKILVEGFGKGAYTDISGNYAITDLPNGTYMLTFKYDSYKVDTVRNIQVVQGSPVTIDVKLAIAVQEITEMNVSKTVAKDNTSGVVQMQINSARVIDGISGETIKRGTDSKAAKLRKRPKGIFI